MLAAISSALLSASEHLSQRPPPLGIAPYLHPVVRHLTDLVVRRVMEGATLVVGAACVVTMCCHALVFGACCAVTATGSGEVIGCPVGTCCLGSEAGPKVLRNSFRHLEQRLPVSVDPKKLQP